MIKAIIIAGALFLAGCAHITPPNFGGGCPMAYPVKGNADSFIYHTPSSPYYERTKAEICFTDVTVARNAGYRSHQK